MAESTTAAFGPHLPRRGTIGHAMGVGIYYADQAIGEPAFYRKTGYLDLAVRHLKVVTHPLVRQPLASLKVGQLAENFGAFFLKDDRLADNERRHIAIGLFQAACDCLAMTTTIITKEDTRSPIRAAQILEKIKDRHGLKPIVPTARPAIELLEKLVLN